MKLTAKVKLNPTPEQTQALRDTLAKANAVCNQISEWVWEHQTFGQWTLQKQLYYSLRASSGLSAQMTVRAIAKVADAYKLDKKRKRTFKPTGSIAYDERILRWHVDKRTISIWTTAGRMLIPFVCGEHQAALLKTQQGESDLGYLGGSFYLFATCNVEEPIPQDVKGVLGVDLGIKNIAADSDGTLYSGAQANGLRRRHRRLRAKLQTKGTKSARRLLVARRRKEGRFGTDINHCISKRIVANAQGTGRAIALEQLKGITRRVKVRSGQRATLHSWSFSQLASFISYKARVAGIPVFFVDPRNTSRTCPSCGSIDKANRPSQSRFLCVSCGFSGIPDTIAAGIIASRAAVNRPYAVRIQPPNCKPPALAGGS